MMEEVWRWKVEVMSEIAGMNSEQRIAYFQKSMLRFEEKTGKKLELRCLERRKQNTVKKRGSLTFKA